MANEYAQAGVDYKKIEPFKAAMIEVAARTVHFPNRRSVYVDTDLMHAHGGVWSYRGAAQAEFCNTQEGLGNEDWITELMYQGNPSASVHFACDAYDNAMMAVNDVLAQGALPVVFTDEVAASDSDWFQDNRRAASIATGFYEACKDAGMALVAGESPVYKYLINPRPPVKSAAVFGGTVTGIIAPYWRKITGKHMQPGDRIIGMDSSGVHANGISLVIQRVMGDEALGIKALPNGFDTRLPSGMTIGEAVHIKTICYVPAIEALLEAGIDIHALLPGTGDGVGKLGWDKRPYCCHVERWPQVPELFLLMRELGVSLEGCLKTFNWGVGYYAFVPKNDAEKGVDIITKAGFNAMDIGVVEEGQRGTIFGLENNLFLPPPGE